MKTTKQLTETQKRALEIIEHLSKEEKIELGDAIALIMAVYENETEYVYIPYTSPWYPYPETHPFIQSPDSVPDIHSTPWWEYNKILCDHAKMNNANNIQGPRTWTTNTTTC